MINWSLFLTSTSIVRRPVFACHAHHLRVLGFVSSFTPDFTTSSHHIPAVLPSGCATAHVTMLQLNGCTPRSSWKQRKNSTEAFIRSINLKCITTWPWTGRDSIKRLPEAYKLTDVLFQSKNVKTHPSPWVDRFSGFLITFRVTSNHPKLSWQRQGCFTQRKDSDVWGAPNYWCLCQRTSRK